MIHVMAATGLGGAAMAAPVVGDDAIPVLEEEQHLRVPIIGRQRPAVAEDNRLAGAPVFVVDLRAVLSGYRVTGRWYGHSFPFWLEFNFSPHFCFTSPTRNLKMPTFLVCFIDPAILLFQCLKLALRKSAEAEWS